MNTEYMLLGLFGKPRLSMEETCKAIGIATQTGYNRRNNNTFPIPMSGNPLSADIRDVAKYLDSLREAEK